MTAPSISVEVAFDSGYSTPAADRTWTDVTDYVLKVAGLGITRGRADEVSEIDASQLQLTLDNSDGRFTAGLATGAYYPDVKVGRPIRVYTGVGFGEGGFGEGGLSGALRFTGYVDAWPVEWPASVGSFATAAVTASSRRARTNLGDARLSAVEESALAESPGAYYTLGDAEGSGSAADSSGTGNAPLRVTGDGAAVVFGSATGPGSDDLTAAQFAGGQYLRAELEDAPDVAFSCFFLRAGVPAAAETLLDINNGGMSLVLETDGKLSLYFLDALITQTAGSVCDGTTHHAYAGHAAGAILYLDGALVGSAGVTVLSFSNVVLSVGGGFNRSPLTGVVAHAAVFDSTASASDVAVMATAGLTGFDGDTSDEWIARLAAWEGVPTAEQDLDAGEAAIDGLRPSGGTVVDLMTTVATTENGLLFDDKDGSLRFRNRSHRYNQASAFTLDVDSSEVEADYAAVLDRTGLINDATASSVIETVPAARIVNTASRGEYGTAQDGPELATADEDELTSAAGWRVNTYGEPRTRVPTISVELAKLSAADQAAILAADIGTRFTVTNAPANAPATTADYVIEGYAEEIGPETHRITFNVSDATIWDVFELDSAALGELDDDRLAW